MDTIKLTNKKDTIISNNNRTIQHTTVEITKKQGCKECSNWWCNCNLLSNLIWPITILIILFLFYKKIGALIEILIDRIDRGDTLKIGKDGFVLQGLSASQIEEKTLSKYIYEVSQPNNEFKEAKASIVKRYLEVEDSFCEILVNFFYKEFRIIPNTRLDGYEYDVIMESLSSNEIDYIFEIKYYPHKFSISNLRQALEKFELSSNYYTSKSNRRAKAILINILGQNDYQSTNYLPKYYSNIGILTITLEEISSLSKENLLKIMHTY